MSETIDTTGEEWRTIAEFPTYSVSNLGRVRNDFPMKRSSAVTFIKPHTNTSGYTAYTLFRRSVQKQRGAHRLVALAFLDPDPNPDRNQVNHKNGVKSDNYVSNLEWMTQTENVRHSFHVLGRQGMRGERNPKAVFTEADVIYIRRLLSDGTPRRTLCEQFSVSKTAIESIATGKTWRHVT